MAIEQKENKANCK